MRQLAFTTRQGAALLRHIITTPCTDRGTPGLEVAASLMDLGLLLGLGWLLKIYLAQIRSAMETDA